MTIPPRPRICEHVLVRRHLAGEDEHFVLHDTESGVVLRLTPIQWELLRQADGTRDLTGIVLGARRAGVPADDAEAARFLERVADHGMLEDGPEEHEEVAPPRPGDRPLDVLPDYRFRCHGDGICCRVFGSILFSPYEASRARVVAGETAGELFLPVRGTARTEALAVTMRDGRCFFLEGDGRCRIHAEAGIDAKPAGCQLFPARHIDDGERIRISVHVECSCVVDSVGDPGGEPLVPERARIRSDLDVRTFIPALQEELDVAGDRTASRAEVRQWFAALAGKPPPADLAAAYFALGEALAREGLSESALDAFVAAPPIPTAAIRPWLESASQHLRVWHGTFSAFRSERDLVLRAIGWLADAAAALLPALDEETLVVPPLRPEAEALSFRSDVHGYAFFGMLPLASALRARAVRALIARTLPSVLTAEDAQESACRDPWTLVEAMFRGHGLDAYARALT